eukprot:7404216-Pyramimonas_sp.AAC.1
MKQLLQKNRTILSDVNAVTFARCWSETTKGDISRDTVVSACLQSDTKWEGERVGKGRFRRS